MSFGDPEFLVFFAPLALLLYWLVPRRAAVQNAVLLGLSYLFYMSWDPRLLGVLVATTAVNYALARVLGARAEARAEAGAHAGVEAEPDAGTRWLFRAGVAFNLGLLLAFKYTGFLAESLDALLGAAGIGVSLPFLRVALPLGISFWTLQNVAYLTDVHLGRTPACRSPLIHALFIAFFPQITSGPIVRGGELLPQLAEARRPSAEDFACGVGQFFLGFAMKFLVGATVGQILVDPVFAAPAEHTTAMHWAGMAGYAVQVFGDFAGYSEMAIGCARLFGLRLPVNFNYPFFALNMLEFWRRWHMTLTAWLFDYVYSPLVTGRSWLRGRLDLGFVIVFMISGLWHGATWGFVFWGLLHGLGLVAHRRWDERYKQLCRTDRRWVARRKSPAYRTAAWAITQLFFLLTLVPFRAGTVAGALVYARGLVAPAGTEGLDLGGFRVALGLVVALTLFVAYHVLGTEGGRRARERFFSLPVPVRGAAYGLLVVYMLIFMPLTSSTFIYAQF